MSTVTIQDAQWSKILQFLRSCPGVYIGQEAHCRRFIESVLWLTRSGAEWRLLPEGYGNWNSVYKRFARWCDKDVWERMHQHFVDDPDMEHLLIDSTVIRAHPCAAGHPRRKAVKPNKRWAAAAVDSARKSTSTSMFWATLCGSR